MYVACRELKTLSGKKAEGDHIPEADSWQADVLKKHLDLGWIKKVEGEEKAKVKKTKKE